MFWKKFFIVIGILIIGVFFAQLIAAPYIKGTIIDAAKKATGTDISIQNCAVSVLKRRVVIEDITVSNPEYKDDYLFKTKEMSVDFYLMPFLFNKYILRTISMTNPEIILHLDGRGALNAPLFKKEGGENTGIKASPEVLFGRFLIKNGNLKFIDHRVSNPATITVFSGIDADVSNSLSGKNGTILTEVKIAGKIESEGQFTAQGKGNLVSAPVNFVSQITVKDIPLPKFSSYYKGNLSIIVKSGNLSGYAKALCENGNLNLQGDVKIDDIDLEPLGDPSQTILFELKTSDVINFLKDENNAVNFSFEINGDLLNPDFKWGPEVLRAVKKAMFRAITEGVGRLFQSPAEAGERIGKIIGAETGEKIKKIGRELQKILGK